MKMGGTYFWFEYEIGQRRFLFFRRYNGEIPGGNDGRRRSKFLLQQRSRPNGLRAKRQHFCKNNDQLRQLTDTDLHSITYTLSKHQTIIVHYDTDSEFDMFQIGRSSENQIDCVVFDTASSTKNLDDTGSQSTISRYACRIMISRSPPYTARLYAAGFDASRNIFLGERSMKWKNNRDEFDGVTTNGILLMNLEDGQFTANATATAWREVSVGGYVFETNDCRSKFAFSSAPISKGNNILRDGALIDLCGATLLWRTAEGLKRTPTRRFLELELERLNSKKPQCPVNMNTLVIRNSPMKSLSSHPYVYVVCGHVHGYHGWGFIEDKSNQSRECPLCRTVSPLIPIIPGMEPALYVRGSTENESTTSHVFHPCGHMISYSTALFWSKIKIPIGNKGSKSLCPFCSISLSETKPFVRLIFQD